MAEERSTYRATAADAGARLDQFLVTQIAGVSRSRVQQLIERGKVEVDARPASRAGVRLSGGEEVCVIGHPQPPPLKAKPENIPLEIIFEDDSLAVVNKSAGMMVHAGAGMAESDEKDDPRTRGTLVNALLYHFKKLSRQGGELRPGIVHRLDKETSGLIIIAKTDVAHRALAEQFSQRRVRKKYFALVHGWLKMDKGTVAAAVGRDPLRRNRMSTRVRQGRSAISHYEVAERLDTAYGKFSFVAVTIETGRTHQIRVHLSALGHPVVGDTLYGAAHQLVPIQPDSSRAAKANTKKKRDRAVTERARALSTEPASLASTVRAMQKPEPVALGRNFLHAAEIGFTHPKSHKSLSLKSDLPLELRRFLEHLRASKK